MLLPVHLRIWKDVSLRGARLHIPASSLHCYCTKMIVQQVLQPRHIGMCVLDPADVHSTIGSTCPSPCSDKMCAYVSSNSHDDQGPQLVLLRVIRPVKPTTKIWNQGHNGVMSSRELELNLRSSCWPCQTHVGKPATDYLQPYRSSPFEDGNMTGSLPTMPLIIVR